MSRLVQAGVGYFVGVYTGNWTLFASALIGAHQDRVARRERRRALAKANSEIPDRLETVDITPDAPRTLVLGTVRAVEGVRRKWVSGAYNEKLTRVISVAGHQIDDYEAFFFFDQELTLDGDGWVLTAPYFKARRETLSTSGTLDGSGNATLTLDALPTAPFGQVLATSGPVAGTVFAAWSTGSGGNLVQGSASVSMAGSTATITGGQPGADVTVTYCRDIGVSFARIRAWTGAPGQNVGAALAAEYPGKITATDKFTNIPVMVVDTIYDTDVYPQGAPQTSARLRGARVYDPRRDSTVPGGSGSHRLADPTTWEFGSIGQNVALCTYHYARWANGWAVPAAEIRTADVLVAADRCDISTGFTLRKADGSTSTVTLPRHTCGMVISSAADPRASMDELLEAMAGRTAWCGGQLRMRAGMMLTPAFNLTRDWVAQSTSINGEPSSEPAVSIVNGTLRENRVNRVTGKCYDADQRYQLLPFPAYEDEVLIAAKGVASAEVEYSAVSHIAHAQHLASIAIRESMASLRMTLQCGMSAWPCEVLDVGTVNLARFGMVDKTMEVAGTRWHPTEGVRLQLEEITEAMFTPVTELKGRDPAPDSGLPRPWQTELLTGLAVTSNLATLVDGSIVTRTVVTWDPATTQSVRQGGDIEIQYADATGDLPAGEWPSVSERGTATSTTIVGLPAGRYVRVRVRPVHYAPGPVRGDWTVATSHKVAGPRAPIVFRQDAEPTGDVRDGDEWYDSNDGDKHYLRISGVFTLVRDSGIQAAQDAADDAQAAADAALANLSNIASDGLLTPDEKPRIIQDRDVIVAEQGGIDAQATSFGITTEKTAYDAAVTALTTYLATLTSAVLWSDLAGNTTIVGTTFRSKFADVYTTRQTLLNKIYGQAKTLADAAASAASSAQTAANNANSALADIASDALLTPDEKPRVIMDFDVIVAEQADIDAKATAQGITTLKTTYDTSVAALTTYLGTLTAAVAWNNLTGNTTIVGATFRAKFSDVYAARQALMNSIAVTIANGAVGTGNLATQAATEVIPNFKASLSQGFTTSIFGLAQLQINDTLNYTNATGGSVEVEITLAAAHSLTVSGASNVSANGMYLSGTINGSPITYTDPVGFDATSIAPGSTSGWRIGNGFQLTLANGDVLAIKTVVGLQGASGATGTLNTSNAILKLVIVKR